jgi:hypothetical protein
MRPYKDRARAALSRHPKTYSRLREMVDVGIPLEGGTEPSSPIVRNRDPHDYSLAFLRAPLGHKPTPIEWSMGSHSNSPLATH